MIKMRAVICALGLGSIIALGAQSALGQATESSSRPAIATIPTAAERLEAWRSQRPGQPVQASVHFTSLLPDQRVSQLLEQAGVKPFAVHMFLEDRYGVHRTSAERASLDLIGKARASSVTMQLSRGKSLQRRANEVKARGVEQSGSLAKALPEIAEQRRNALASLRGGAPIIYGVSVVGTEAQLQALRSIQGVAKVEPGLLLSSGRVAVPTPAAPLQKGRSARVRSQQELQAEIDALASGNLGD